MFVTEAGTGTVTIDAGVTQLTAPGASRTAYSNAQITSYRTRREFECVPPLRVTVTAQAEGTLHGTAGFGLWNHPFAPGEHGVRLPKAAWFFHSSPPSNMALAKGVPGYGWKAATFDATRPEFFALLPTAPVGVLLMQIPSVYNALWEIGQRAIGVSERLLDPTLLQTPHIYSIDWLRNEVIFAVDNVAVHQTPLSPSGKLGFIAWVDNQYAVVTPQGHFGFGLVDAPQSQSLILNSVTLTRL